MGLPYEYPVTLGRDFAGVVEQVGDGVTSVAVGDEVFGEISAFNPPVHDGTWAENIVVGEQSFAKKPAGVDAAQAGAAPVVTLTALATVDALELSAGQTVVVVGATGGVGSIVVQLAKAAGATVIAPALPEDEEFLRGLGVDEVLPREGDLVAAVRERYPEGVDALVDAVTPMQPTPYDAILPTAAASPRRRTLPARAPAAPTSCTWRSSIAKGSTASGSCSPTARSRCRSSRPTTSRRRTRRSAR